MYNLTDTFYQPLYIWVTHNIDERAPLARIEQKHILLSQDIEQQMSQLTKEALASLL